LLSSIGLGLFRKIIIHYLLSDCSLTTSFFLIDINKWLDIGWEKCDNKSNNWNKVEKSGETLSGFYGQFQTTMDSKGRFALPAKLRAVKSEKSKKSFLDGNILITKGLEGCLKI